jgi:hypothetical protein
MNDLVLLPERIPKPSLGKTALEGHLPTFETCFGTPSRTGILSLVPLARRLAVAGTDAPSHTFPFPSRSLRGCQFSQIHASSPSSSLHHFHQMVNPLDHASNLRPIRQDPRLMEPFESKAFEGLFLTLVTPNGAPLPFHLQALFHGPSLKPLPLSAAARRLPREISSG